jgi:hypothetical protein
MRKIWMTLFAVLLAATLAVAQDKDKDKDNSAKHEMQEAGHNTKEAAKKVGSATKHAAVAAKNKVHHDDAREDTAERRDADRDAAQDRARANESAEERNERIARERADRDRNRSMLPQSDRESRREEALERSVHIVRGPDVDTGDRSATIRWETNKTAATDVWLTGGGIRGHRTAYVRGGSNDHTATFANLRPNTTYHYEIRTREGGDRREGTFTTR